MKDEDKTKTQLIAELRALRQQTAALPAVGATDEQITQHMLRLASAVQMSSDSIVVTDMEGKLLEVNAATLKMYGSEDSADLIGKSAFEIIIPEDLGVALRGREEALEQGHINSQRYRVITKSGTILPVEMNVATVLKGRDSTPIGFVAITRDVSERRLMEEERQHLYELARDLIGASDVHTIAAALFQHTGTLLSAKYQALMLTNAEGTELVGIISDGAGDPEVFRQERIDLADDFAGVVAALRQAPIVEIPDVAHTPLLSERLRAKYAFLPYVWIVPLRAGERLIGVFAVSQVTCQEEALPVPRMLQMLGNAAALALERVHLTEELCERELRLSAIFATSPDSIYVFDLQGRFMEANAPVLRYTGLSVEQLRGRHFCEFIESDSAARMLALFDEVKTGRPLTTFEFRDKEFGQRSSVYEVSATSLRNAQGEPTAVLCLARDITLRKQAEEERRNLEVQLFEARKLEALGTLARGVAHDFNNILSAIMGFTELVLDEVPRRTSAHENLTEVLKASRRAKMLVQHILTFSRLAREQYAPMSLFPIIEDTLSFVSATLPAAITLRVQLDREAGLVAADPSRIQQLLMNLCINAVQAMRARGGTLDVTLQRVELIDCALVRPGGLPSGAYLKLTVCDTGPGMTTEVQARIFDPFFTTKRVGEGTGLGLAIVHGIVTSHGGAITVESAPGQGAAFHVYLPATHNAAVPTNLRHVWH